MAEEVLCCSKSANSLMASPGGQDINTRVTQQPGEGTRLGFRLHVCIEITAKRQKGKSVKELKRETKAPSHMFLTH